MIELVLFVHSDHTEHSHLVLGKTHHLQWEQAWAVREIQHERLNSLKPLGARGDRLNITVEHFRILLLRYAISAKDFLPHNFGWALVENLPRVSACHDLFVLANVPWMADGISHLLHGLDHMSIGSCVSLGSILKDYVRSENNAAALL